MVEIEDQIVFNAFDKKRDVINYIKSLADEDSLVDTKCDYYAPGLFTISVYLLKKNSVKVEKVNEKEIISPYLIGDSFLKSSVSDEAIAFQLLNNPDIKIVRYNLSTVYIYFYKGTIYREISINRFMRILKKIKLSESINYEKVLNIMCLIKKDILEINKTLNNRLKEINKYNKKTEKLNKSLQNILNDDEKLFIELKDKI